MNSLTKIKLANNYDLVVNEILKDTTDVDGSTALVTTDGTSWEFVDGEWVRIEEDLDIKISENIYPFITSVCNSIHNHFVLPSMSHCYEKAKIVDDTYENTIKININDDHAIDVVAGDFVVVETKTNKVLTKVISVEDTDDNRSITVEGNNTIFRVTGKEECIKVLYISFPLDFLNVVHDMFAYDLFERESKELRQERLGNYSVVNFAPNEYQGEGSYPKNLEDKIKYWQRVLT